MFGAKTTHFNVISIRNMSFRALTKNFLKNLKDCIFGQKSFFSSKNKISLLFLAKTVLYNLKSANLLKEMNSELREKIGGLF